MAEERFAEEKAEYVDVLFKSMMIEISIGNKPVFAHLGDGAEISCLCKVVE